MNDLELRAAASADRQGIAALEKILFSDAWSEQSVEAALSSPLSFALVAECGGATCGYLLATLLAPEGELYRIGVHPDYRKRGIGRALMEGLLSAAKERAVTDIFLEVRADNAAAIALYRSVGFADNGIRKNYYHAPDADALLMLRSKDNL